MLEEKTLMLLFLLVERGNRPALRSVRRGPAAGPGGRGRSSPARPRENIVDLYSAINSLRTSLGATCNQVIMHSKLANESRKALIASAKRLTREERLRAFVRHSKLVTDLAEASRRARAKSRSAD
jgi:hypothetical protein